MVSSLREQLLKAGLVTEEQVAKVDERATRPRRGPKGGSGKGPEGADAGKRRKNAKRRRGAGKPATAAAGPAPSAPVREEDRRRAREVARDARLRASTPEQRERRRRRQELVRRLDAHKLNSNEADRPYHFLRGKRIKRIYLTGEQHRELLAGNLVVVALEGVHFVVPAPQEASLRELDPELWTHRHDPDEDQAAAAARLEEAEHPVPDDIVW